MTFENPAGLWLLALLPVIVVLYMLRARRQDLEVSSTLLWQRARTDLAAQRPVRRLDRSVLLLLQLLAVALAAAALSRPQLPLAGGGRGTVIVLDTSASMQATDVR
ncbi:MAG: BatA domain-containing protein, partial [bacterium]